jgi:hypothetical protein
VTVEKEKKKEKERKRKKTACSDTMLVFYQGPYAYPIPILQSDKHIL